MANAQNDASVIAVIDWAQMEAVDNGGVDVEVCELSEKEGGFRIVKDDLTAGSHDCRQVHGAWSGISGCF